ncbi:MAG: hypothetical protein ACOYBV_00685 [Candidatus Avilachnospira sp.]|jgi:hypothetical protein
MFKKTYVSVKANFRSDGVILPYAIQWEDGHIYNIDRILYIKPAASSKAGGQGDRYTVIINGHEKHLYFERSSRLSGNIVGRWFVERI